MAKTLLEMAGATYAPRNLNRSVLILIDCQKEYSDFALALPDVAAASENAARTANHVRQGGGSVIHVRHIGGKGGPFDPDHDRGAFLENCTPLTGEAVIGKTLPNAFSETDLAERLTALSPETLILAGFMTHMCISATARAALDLGFGPSVVVANSCATRDLPSATRPGETVAAAALHEAALTALSDRFSFVVNSAEDL